MSKLPSYIPDGFETLSYAKKQRKSLKRISEKHGVKIPPCSSMKRCGKDGCPICSRNFRLNLMKELHRLGGI